MLSIYSYICGLLVCPLWKNVCSNLLHIFPALSFFSFLFFFAIELYEFLICIEHELLFRLWFANICSHSVGYLCWLLSLLCRFLVRYNPVFCLFVFLLLLPTFGVISKKSLQRPMLCFLQGILQFQVLCLSF